MLEKIINETAKIARENFEKFGFNDEQILQLLESGKRDLTLELSKLQQLLKDENTEYQYAAYWVGVGKESLAAYEKLKNSPPPSWSIAGINEPLIFHCAKSY